MFHGNAGARQKREDEFSSSEYVVVVVWPSVGKIKREMQWILCDGLSLLSKAAVYVEFVSTTINMRYKSYCLSRAAQIRHDEHQKYTD